jgi:hypothetical protein
LITALCLIVLGAWGGIIPFVGPYFNYAFINHHAWHYTWGRLWLAILPGAAILVAGFLLLSAANRVTAAFAGWLAAIAGAWFVIGPEISRLWNHGVAQTGRPLGGHVRQTFEWLGYHYALGAAVMLLAAFAIGRVSVAAARDVLAAEGGPTWWRRRRRGTAVSEPATNEPMRVRRAEDSTAPAEDRTPVAARTGAGEPPAEAG